MSSPRETLNYGRPVPSHQGKHKFQVLVWDKEKKKNVVVHFGHRDYEDFTQHKDPDRRENYLSRSAGIRDGKGRLTKDNPASANYWSRRYLWDSKEKYLDVNPPAGETRTSARSPRASARSPRASARSPRASARASARKI